jgi:hypothetical protein
MSKKEVATLNSTAVGQVIDYGDYAGGGFEGQTNADIAIPFINVLQALSPQLEKIDGAKAGMLINTVTEEVFKSDEGVLFIPALTQHVFVEWVPRDKGGGFVGVHASNSDIVARARASAAKKAEETGKDDFGKLNTDSGNQLIETFYVYGVLADDVAPLGMAVLAFTSTKIKVYKKFNTKVRTHLVPTANGGRVNPPLFANLTRIKSFKDKNPKGEFYNFELVPAVGGDLKASLLAPSDPRFVAAVDCKKMVESGVARAAFESQATSGDDSAAGGDKVPF